MGTVRVEKSRDAKVFEFKFGDIAKCVSIKLKFDGVRIVCYLLGDSLSSESTSCFILTYRSLHGFVRSFVC